MRYQTIIVAAVSATSVAGSISQVDRPLSIRSELPEEYRVEPMTWVGVIEEGGPEVSFNGTIEEVTQQIQAMKTDFTWESLRRDIWGSATPLQTRDKVQAGIICGVGGEDAVTHGPLTRNGPLTLNVEESRDKISKMTGTCTVKGGPRVCSIITCTRNAAVWLCNDNVKPIAPSCDSLTSYVDDIIGKCGQDYYHGYKFCRGQEFDNNNFNVVVGWESHC